MSKCPVSVLMSYSTYRSGIDVVPNPPKYPVPAGKCASQPSAPASISYRTYRRFRHHYGCQSVRYLYWCHTELAEVSGTGIDVVTSIAKCPASVLMFYRTYRSVQYRYDSLYRYRPYRYPHRTELTEVYGIGLDVVPNITKCPVPILILYRT